MQYPLKRIIEKSIKIFLFLQASSRSQLGFPCCFFSLLKPILVVSLFELKLMSLHSYEYFSSLSTQFECLLICDRIRLFIYVFHVVWDCGIVKEFKQIMCLDPARRLSSFERRIFLGVSCVLEFSSLYHQQKQNKSF